MYEDLCESVFEAESQARQRGEKEKARKKYALLKRGVRVISGLQAYKGTM